MRARRSNSHRPAEEPAAAAESPREFELNLQFKGFAGGVPQNTETTTEKYLWLQEARAFLQWCLFFVVSKQGAGQSGPAPFHFSTTDVADFTDVRTARDRREVESIRATTSAFLVFQRRFPEQQDTGIETEESNSFVFIPLSAFRLRLCRSVRSVSSVIETKSMHAGRQRAAESPKLRLPGATPGRHANFLDRGKLD